MFKARPFGCDILLTPCGNFDCGTRSYKKLRTRTGNIAFGTPYTADGWGWADINGVFSIDGANALGLQNDTSGIGLSPVRLLSPAHRAGSVVAIDLRGRRSDRLSTDVILTNKVILELIVIALVNAYCFRRPFGER